MELKLPGGPERWRVIAVAAGGRHSLVLALPDSGNLAQRQLEVGCRDRLKGTWHGASTAGGAQQIMVEPLLWRGGQPPASKCAAALLCYVISCRRHSHRPVCAPLPRPAAVGAAQAAL